MTHKFRKGDKVGVWVSSLQAHIPAKVVNVNKNLIDAKIITPYDGQTLAFIDYNVVMLEPVPRPKRKIYRVSERLKQ